MKFALEFQRVNRNENKQIWPCATECWKNIHYEWKARLCWSHLMENVIPLQNVSEMIILMWKKTILRTTSILLTTFSRSVVLRICVNYRSKVTNTQRCGRVICMSIRVWVDINMYCSVFFIFVLFQFIQIVGKSYFLRHALSAKPKFTLFNCYWSTFAFWENHNTTSKA